MLIPGLYQTVFCSQAEKARKNQVVLRTFGAGVTPMSYQRILLLSQRTNAGTIISLTEAMVASLLGEQIILV
jgi:hypothetical protein